MSYLIQILNYYKQFQESWRPHAVETLKTSSKYNRPGAFVSPIKLNPLKKSHVSEELMLFRSWADENTPACCRGQIVGGSAKGRVSSTAMSLWPRRYRERWCPT